LLVAGYGDAFRMLLHGLTAVTVLSAIAVFGFLSRAPRQEPLGNNEAVGSNA
jgi:hypothetical protein